MEDREDTITKERKAMLEMREDMERKNTHLLNSIYEMVVHIQADMEIERQEKKIKETKEKIDSLTRELGYLEDDIRYKNNRRYEKLDNRYRY